MFPILEISTTIPSMKYNNVYLYTFYTQLLILKEKSGSPKSIYALNIYYFQPMLFFLNRPLIYFGFTHICIYIYMGREHNKSYIMRYYAKATLYILMSCIYVGFIIRFSKCEKIVVGFLTFISFSDKVKLLFYISICK